MSLNVENGIAHYPDRREITQQLIEDHDSGQGDESPPRLSGHSSISSEDSHDSSEERNNQINNKRKNKLKVRSISVSTDSEEVNSCQYRGILKYGGNSRLRSLSESCAENYSSSPYHGESLSALDECWYEEVEEEDEDDGDDGPKVKKTVRFSDTVHKQLFRSNSSILGQRKKNQRKKGNKAKKTTKSTPPNNSINLLGSSTESESAGEALEAMSSALDNVTLSDSGIDASDSDPCATDNFAKPCNGNNNRAPKKSKKQKKAQSRQRRASESNVNSHSGEMIFDLDL